MIKKIHSLLLITACLAIGLSAGVLSCTDHNIENPETSCIRVDGSPRFYPCEFEFVKAEFTNKLNRNEVVATVTPKNRKVNIPVNAAWSYYHPSPGYADITFKVLLHIKRVSNPSVSSSNQYVIPFLNSGTTNMDAQFALYQFPPVFPPVSQMISIANGETFITAVDAFYHVKESLLPGNKAVYSDLTGNTAFLIYNMSAASILAATPHNYHHVFDLAESHIIIEPTIVE